MASTPGRANPGGLSRLLVLPKYSDLQLVCEEEIFPVHKAIVCSQSPVLAAAVDSDFLEAKSGIIHIEEFDAKTLKRMLSFMYGVEYETTIDEEQKESPCPVLENNESEDSKKEDVDCEIPSSTTKSTAKILLHVKVNAIADYYDVPPLKQLANANIKILLENQWSKDGFLDVVEDAFKATSDTELHKIVATATTLHIDELIMLEDFSRTLVMGESLIHVMKDFVGACKEETALARDELQAARLQLRSVERQLEVATLSAKNDRDRATGLLNHVNVSMRHLSKTRYCRNTSCDAEFTCYFERLGRDDDPKFLLRCAKCECKHP